MGWKLLHRMVLLELLRTLALSLPVMVGLMTLLELAAIMGQGLLCSLPISLLTALALQSLPFTIPCALLFSGCMVYGRLAHDQETLALRAAGLNPLWTLCPAVVLGLLLSAVSMALFHGGIAWSWRRARQILVQELVDNFERLIKRERGLTLPSAGYALSARTVSGDKLLDVVLTCQNRDGWVARAREGQITWAEGRTAWLLHLHEGQLQTDKENAVACFQDQVWRLPLPADPFSGMLRAGEMSWPELVRQENAARDQAARQPEKRDDLIARARRLRTERMMRPALALSCLGFLLIGCPVGMYFGRGDYFSNFFLCFLPVVCTYYTLMAYFNTIGRRGRCDSDLTQWFPNFMLLAVAVVFIWREGRR
jgi:lipopolysaccharide export system permease protein